MNTSYRIKLTAKSSITLLLLLILKLLRKISKAAKIDFNEISIEHDIKNKQLNNHLFSSKKPIRNTYISYIPDRYNLKLDIYRQQVDFLKYNDLNNWLEGNYENNAGDFSRFFFLNLCIDYLLEDHINGNVAELGVYKGNSAVLLARYANSIASTCYLFDTFDGFDSRDLIGVDTDIKKDAFDDTSVEYVKNNVGHDDNVVYVKGYFPESLSQVGELDSFSLIHIDCDLEKPFVDSLNYFYPKVMKGGFIIMHDHSSLCWPGAKRAIDTFFADKLESVIPIPDKSGTCVIRKV